MPMEHLVEKLIAFEPQADLPFVSLYLNAQADEHGKQIDKRKITGARTRKIKR